MPFSRMILLLLTLLGPFFFPFNHAWGAVPWRFTYPASKDLASVHLAGSFNNWDRHRHPLALDREAKYYFIEINLETGKNFYKFILNGNQWVNDPRNSKLSEDGFGGANNFVEITGDMAVNNPAQQPLVDFSPDGAHLFAWGDGRFTLRVTTAPAITALRLHRPEGSIPLEQVARFVDSTLFELHFESFTPSTLSAYYFTATTTDGQNLFFDARGLQDSGESLEPFRQPATTPPPFQTPRWLEGRIFYQIFPDRFAKTAPARHGQGLTPWGGKPTHHNHFGGTLRGIREHLPYLRKVGFDALYLNPIHTAPSNHKYDASDYFKVDPSFGTLAEFRQLLAACHAEDVRVILDGVFNHTGDRHFAFRDIMRNGSASRYRDWYRVHSWPIRQSPKPNYDCWWGYAHLPALNHRHPDVINHLREVVDFWVGLEGIDGFRLDVPNELPLDFWPGFRGWMKRHPQDPYIVGEIWEEARPWLQGDMFDGVMNYPLRKAILDLLSPKNPTGVATFTRSLAKIYAAYPPPAWLGLLNLLGSHDVPRIATELGGGDRVRLAFSLLFSHPGAPMIYYGDEIGMTGGKDPDNRRCFDWRERNWDHSLLNHIRRLIAARRAHPVFSRGLPQFPDQNGPLGYLFFKDRARRGAVLFNPTPNPLPFSLHGPTLNWFAGKTTTFVFADGVIGEGSLADTIVLSPFGSLWLADGGD